MRRGRHCRQRIVTRVKIRNKDSYNDYNNTDLLNIDIILISRVHCQLRHTQIRHTVQWGWYTFRGRGLLRHHPTSDNRLAPPATHLPWNSLYHILIPWQYSPRQNLHPVQITHLQAIPRVRTQRNANNNNNDYDDAKSAAQN